MLAAIPIGFKNTHDQRTILEKINYPIPETIGEHSSLMEGYWMQQWFRFRYVQEFRDRHRGYELKTLAQFDRIARQLEQEVSLEAPNPPEPGDLDHRVVTA